MLEFIKRVVFKLMLAGRKRVPDVQARLHHTGLRGPVIVNDAVDVHFFLRLSRLRTWPHTKS